MTANSVEILLVEDNPNDELLALHAFKKHDLADKVHVVRDGVEALRFLRREGEHADAPRPDVILLDISMPGTDGLETARLLREQTPEAKILIMSQHDVSLISAAAIEAGANGCVDKSRLSADVLTGILSRLRP